ncbi:hypothetical protein GCM10025865_20340 [Paraoerskovia sediminicola]|uniref:Laminin G domain-containing protein n=1 Tax=Paraoerskovia sediminicola TaxID=1138587 RepID=A0ABM8G3Q8_9CELL|nr:hypothetical protein GCM10025865_20340 [Paraoerskovia sediminicola]
MSFVDTDVVAGRTYSYRLTVSDGTNTTSRSAASSATALGSGLPYASRVLNDGANLYWRFGESSGPVGADSSGADRAPRYMQNVSYRSADNAALDDPGYAMGFDGSTAYAFSDDIAPAPTTYSVETWFRTTSTSGGKIVGYGNGQPRNGTNNTSLSGSYDRHVYMTNDGRLVFGAYTGSAVTLTSAGSFNDGEWHSVVATQGPAGMTLYVDGVRVGRNSNASAQSYDGSWRVGGDQLNGWPSRPSSNFFAGDIDETAVYPTVLPAATVREHFTASGRVVDVPQAPADAYGAAVYSADPDLFWRLDDSSATTAADASPYGVTGTYDGRVTTGSDGALEDGTAVSFSPQNASNGGVIGSDLQFTNPRDYSLELWFNSTTTDGGKLIGLGNNKTSLSSNYDRHVFLRDDGRLVFGTWTGQQNLATSDASFNDGAWHHVVATQSSTSGMSSSSTASSSGPTRRPAPRTTPGTGRSEVTGRGTRPRRTSRATSTRSLSTARCSRPTRWLSTLHSAPVRLRPMPRRRRRRARSPQRSSVTTPSP